MKYLCLALLCVVNFERYLENYKGFRAIFKAQGVSMLISQTIRGVCAANPSCGLCYASIIFILPYRTEF